jgi:aminopeptidase-like protein
MSSSQALPAATRRTVLLLSMACFASMASQRISSGRLLSICVCMALVKRLKTSDSSVCASTRVSMTICTSPGSPVSHRKRSSLPMM